MQSILIIYYYTYNSGVYGAYNNAVGIRSPSNVVNSDIFGVSSTGTLEYNCVKRIYLFSYSILFGLYGSFSFFFCIKNGSVICLKQN